MPNGFWACDCAEMIKALSVNLYTEPMVAVRELLCNALDAVQRGAGRGVRVRVRDGSLEIEDDGCGISSDEVPTALGTAFFSGTRRASAERGAGEAPIGKFGVGLLSARAVARRVEITSWTRADALGVLWQWDGAEAFSWRPTSPRGRVGTVVRLWPLASLQADLLDEVRLTEFVRRHLAYVHSDVFVGSLSGRVNDSSPPWCRPRVDADELRAWVEGTGELGCLRAEWARASAFPGGGCVACFPGEQTRFFADVTVYRSGVLITNLPRDLVDPAFAWIKLVVDAPGVGVTLDRSAIDAEGAPALRAEVTTFLHQALRGFVRWGAADPQFPRAWWSQHRQELLASLAAMARDGANWPLEEVAGWLPFATESGWMTFHELHAAALRHRRSIAGLMSEAVEEAVAEATTVLVVRWSSADEREVFMALARTRGVELVRPFAVTERGRLGWSLPSIDARVRGLVDAVRQVLARFKIEVGVTQSGGRSNELATWSQPPAWVAARPYNPRGVRRDPGAPELHIFADSEVICALARNVDTLAMGAVAWLLVESASVPEKRDAVVRALYGLLGSKQAVAAPTRRCFVAYDWTEHRDTFAAIRTALTPLGITAVDASHEAQGNFIFDNILKVMLSCHMFVTVLTAARVGAAGGAGAGATRTLNANLLFEAGLAAAFVDRPQILCHPEGLEVPTDLQGRLTLRYRDLPELTDRLAVEMRKQVRVDSGRVGTGFNAIGGA